VDVRGDGQLLNVGPVADKKDDAFFSEWHHDLPELTPAEQQALDRIQQNYLYLLEYPVMESIVKMVVLSPLLDLAGFYAPPFRVDGETSIQVSAEDEWDLIQGCIDVVVIQEQLWVTVIDANNDAGSDNILFAEGLSGTIQLTSGVIRYASMVLLANQVPPVRFALALLVGGVEARLRDPSGGAAVSCGLQQERQRAERLPSWEARRSLIWAVEPGLRAALGLREERGRTGG